MTTESNNCIQTLKTGGLIIFPTKTGRYVGCNSYDDNSVDKLLNLAANLQGIESVCLVSNQAMLERHVESLPDVAYDLMDFTTKPLTLILDGPRAISEQLISKQKTMAFRVADDKFCQSLIYKLGNPIFAVPITLFNSGILKGVDYVVNLPAENENFQQDSIIKLKTNGLVEVIRE